MGSLRGTLQIKGLSIQGPLFDLLLSAESVGILTLLITRANIERVPVGLEKGLLGFGVTAGLQTLQSFLVVSSKLSEYDSIIYIQFPHRQ